MISLSIATVLVPALPWTWALAPRAVNSVAGSEWGSAKQRLPPSVPQARTRMLATLVSISANTGKLCLTSAERSMARWVALPPMMSAPFFNFDFVQVGNGFDIDQVLVAQEIMLHRQQQLGAAGIEPALFAELGEHLRRFGNGFRLMNREFS